jgi:NitT/TauT family transport system permease protein
MAPRRRGPVGRFFASTFVAVSVVVLAIILIWYAGAVLLNANSQNLFDSRDNITRTFPEFVKATWNQPKPRLPAPHQVAQEIYKTTVGTKLTSANSLFWHGWVTLSSTLLGFAMGTVLGIGLAVLIVHVRSLDRSLMPWIVSSQTIPILAIAPMLIVVMAAIGLRGLIPKALISTYLSFFPVTVGMVGAALSRPDQSRPDAHL